MPIKKIKITDLVQDDRNLNRGNARGNELIETSVGRFGAGRSVLIDKNNRIIAGNKTQEAAIAKGIKDVIVVETDGTQLVAVKRNDVDLDSKDGREMALADNATVKADLEWDTEQMESIAEDFGIDMEAWDVDAFDIEDVAVGESLTDQLKAQEFIEKENYFVKKPFVVIFYEDYEKRHLENILGIEIQNDTYTYEQLRKGDTDSLSE
jgi:hypothetical protein